MTARRGASVASFRWTPGQDSGLAGEPTCTTEVGKSKWEPTSPPPALKPRRAFFSRREPGEGYSRPSPEPAQGNRLGKVYVSACRRGPEGEK